MKLIYNPGGDNIDAKSEGDLEESRTTNQKE